ncbi:MAG: YkgJ family cysteine cluster protein [Pseudomonadota bacterium]
MLRTRVTYGFSQKGSVVVGQIRWQPQSWFVTLAIGLNKRHGAKKGEKREPNKGMKLKYDCSKCPGYCCSYPVIELKNGDIKRIAGYLNMPKTQVREHFVRTKKKADRMNNRIGVLKHQDDDIYGTICTFFDIKKRRCGIYPARPEVCRDYPGGRKCGYYDFLSFERETQDDPDHIALTGN